MSVAALALAALAAAVAISCVSSVNVGLLSIVFAWLVGVYAGGMRVDQVLAGFPTALFLTLVGVTLLFAQAQVNGTLDRLAHRAIRVCRGHAGVIPMLFFALTAALSSIGPGNIASTALMAPIGMAAAGRYAIPPFLMAIMIANGASAGSVSPFAPTGIVVNGVATRIGLAGAQWPVYVNNFGAHAAVAFAGYFLLGGARLFTRPASSAPDGAAAPGGVTATGDAVDLRFQPRHHLTIAVIALLVISVVLFNVNVGLAALGGAMVLTIARAADEGAAVKAMPWPVILMVSGITMLVAILERTGGMDLFTSFLARFTTPVTVIPAAAFLTGVISIYSSTTGVVLPALLPTIPGLIARIGGGDPMALLSAMVVGGHLVDVSPLSTLGALCLAAAPPGTDPKRLFNALLAWGAAMSVVGAAVCWLLFAVL